MQEKDDTKSIACCHVPGVLMYGRSVLLGCTVSPQIQLHLLLSVKALQVHMP
jgi:hypothetical protein